MQANRVIVAQQSFAALVSKISSCALPPEALYVRPFQPTSTGEVGHPLDFLYHSFIRTLVTFTNRRDALCSIYRIIRMKMRVIFPCIAFLLRRMRLGVQHV
jgi:hypothetical protein